MHVKRSPRVFWLIATLNLSSKMVYIPKIRRNIDMLGCVPLRFTTPTIALVLVLVFLALHCKITTDFNALRRIQWPLLANSANVDRIHLIKCI